MSSFELLEEVGMKGSAFKYYDEESDWKGGCIFKGGRIFVDIRTVMPASTSATVKGEPVGGQGDL